MWRIEKKEKNKTIQKVPIGSIGAGNVALGNTGTSSPTGTLNVGINSTIVNLGKTRFTSPPVLSYCFESSAVQSIPNGNSTALVFPTALANSSTQTGITYNASTGVFTNSNSYSVTAIVCVTVGFAFNVTGSRIVFVQHNTASNRITTVDVGANQSDYTYLSGSGCAVLAAGDTVQTLVYQTSGVALNAGDVLNSKSSKISIVVL